MASDHFKERNSLHNNSLQPIRQQVIAQADRLYAGRADSRNVAQSIELLRQADADYETAWRLGRALFFLGQESVEPKIAQRLHAQGVAASRKAIRVGASSRRADLVEGHFWLGVNLALLARLEAPTRAALHALQARQALMEAIAIDASYHAAGPLRVLARLQHKLPRLLGGGIVPARENFERAMRLAPTNTITRIYFAELLLEIGEIDRARSELEVVLHTPLDPDWAFEIERDQRLAEEMTKNCKP